MPERLLPSGAAMPGGRWNRGCFIKLVRAPGGAASAPDPADRRDVRSVRAPEGDPERGRLVPPGVVGDGDEATEGRL